MDRSSGTVLAKDPEGESVTYAILGNTSGAFAIDPVTGAITVANSAALPRGPNSEPRRCRAGFGLAGRILPLKSVNVTVALRVNATPDQWRQNRFGASAADPNVAGDSADPDGDHVPNLLEYALGSDPNAATVPGIVVDAEKVGTETYLRLTASRSAATSNIALSVETTGSPDGVWSNTNTTTELDTANTLRVRDNIPMSGANSRFIRLKVTPSP